MRFGIIKNIKRIIIQLFKSYIFIAFIATCLLINVFKLNANFTEKVYSTYAYPVIANIVSWLTHWVKLSFNDLFFIVLGVLLILLPILVILKKMSFKKALISLLKTMAVVYILFYWLWGFNYFREPIYSRTKLKAFTVNDSVFNSTYKTVLQLTIENYSNYSDYNKDEIENDIERAFKSSQEFLSIPFPNGRRVEKPMIFSRLIAAASISGYFGPFFNETHMNQLLLPVQHPFILAHEKAHQFGITSEAEASFYAWVACTNCESAQIKYSAGLYVIRYMLRRSKNNEHYTQMLTQIPEYIKEDLAAIRNFWREMEIPWINRFQSKLYDFYLKGNNIPDGVRNYGGVVKMVCEYEMLTKNSKLNSDLGIKCN